MAVTLTKNAANRINQLFTRDSSKKALHLGVKKSGCSGFAYIVELVEEVNSYAHQFKSHNIIIVVAEKDLQYVDGTEIDFIKDGLQENFKFINPQVIDECGCGESFSVK